MRSGSVFVAVAALALAAVVSAPAAPSSPRPKCPLGATAPTGGQVQWSFNVNQPGKLYLYGAGTWSSGAAKGAICSSQTGHDVVLTVSGTAKLEPQITRFGLPGVGLTLPLDVSATDDTACAAGVRGTITFFASYHAVHHDSASVHFEAGCADHDGTYSGSELHVLVARNGAQVN
jgi:hypothetical protein